MTADYRRCRLRVSRCRDGRMNSAPRCCSEERGEIERQPSAAPEAGPRSEPGCARHEEYATPPASPRSPAHALTGATAQPAAAPGTGERAVPGGLGYASARFSASAD